MWKNGSQYKLANNFDSYIGKEKQQKERRNHVHGKMIGGVENK